ncbi:GntR family transcriptional regulator [Cellulomonas fimi]|uniref:GntR family transcriptional regulator n=1 Tax=Cellulomonas sp. RIT-PI-Y TaxID=3035297 RepID=UPI0021DA0412
MTTPKYQELADELRRQIADASIGTPTESERQLADRTGVSRMTARRAIDELVRSGQLTREVGRGTFVARPTMSVPLQLSSFTEDMAARGLVATSRVLGLEVIPASDHLARLFGMDPGEPITLLSRLRLADGAPMAIERSHLRTAVFPGLEAHDFERESLYRVLGEDYGVRFDAGEQVIRAGIVRDEDAVTLSVPTGVPVLELVRTTASQGSVVEWTISTYPASRFELSAQIQPITVQGSVLRSALRVRD